MAGTTTGWADRGARRGHSSLRRASRPEHLGARDPIEAKRATLAAVEIGSVEHRFVALHVDAANADPAPGFDRARVDVRDEERLLLEPGALDGGAHALLARQGR